MDEVIEDMRQRIYDYLQQQKELELADIEANSQLTDEEIRIYKQNSSLIKKLAQLSPASKKAIEDLLEQMK